MGYNLEILLLMWKTRPKEKLPWVATKVLMCENFRKK